MSIFSFLCVIDGVSSIESGSDKGGFKLIFEKNNDQILINDPTKDSLHDLFSSK